MAKAAQAHEPSMEEILASIRRIISDETGGHREPDLDPPETPDMSEEATSDRHWQEVGREAVETALDADTETAEPAVREGATDTTAPAVSEVPQKTAAPAAAAPETPSAPSPAPDPMAMIDPRLLSPGPDAMVTAAFNRLATTILSSQARTLEDLVQDMLRPMLRGWLDENLPAMVERLVREEIERVSRGTRR